MGFDLDISDNTVTPAGFGGEPVGSSVQELVAVLLARVHACRIDDVGAIAKERGALCSRYGFNGGTRAELGALRRSRHPSECGTSQNRSDQPLIAEFDGSPRRPRQLRVFAGEAGPVVVHIPI